MGPSSAESLDDVTPGSFFISAGEMHTYARNICLWEKKHTTKRLNRNYFTLGLARTWKCLTLRRKFIPLPRHGILVPATLPVVEPRDFVRRRELEVMRVRWNGRCADLGEKNDGTLSWTR